MTQSRLKQQTLNLFLDNQTQDITSADMRMFVNNIFDTKENSVLKITDISQFPGITATVLKDDIVIIKPSINKCS
jgi:hypothetical protein